MQPTSPIKTAPERSPSRSDNSTTDTQKKTAAAAGPALKAAPSSTTKKRTFSETAPSTITPIPPSLKKQKIEKSLHAQPSTTTSAEQPLASSSGTESVKTDSARFENLYHRVSTQLLIEKDSSPEAEKECAELINDIKQLTTETEVENLARTNLLVWTLLKANRLSEAERTLTELTSSSAPRPFTLFLLGLLCTKQHKINKGKQYYRKSLDLLSLRDSLPLEVLTPSDGDKIAQIIGLPVLKQELNRQIKGQESEHSSINILPPIPSSEAAANRAAQLYLRKGILAKGKADDEINFILGIRKKHPDLIEPKIALSKLLLAKKPEDPIAMTQCLRLFREIIKARPTDRETMLDCATLLQQVQMARWQLGTHPEDSLSHQIIPLCMNIIRQAPSSVEALRILSVQHGYGQNYGEAHKLLESAFIYLLIGIIKLKEISEKNNLLCKQLKEIAEKINDEESVAQVILQEIKNNPLNPKLKTLLENIIESECFSPSQQKNLSRWIGFIISDMAFLHLKENRGEDQLQKSKNLFEASNHVYEENSSSFFGLSEVYRLLGDKTKRKEYLETSCRIQPTLIVLKALEEVRKAERLEVDE